MTTCAAPVMFGLTLLLATAADAAELAGSEWRPIAIGAMPWTDDSAAFVRFESGRLVGYSGCNRFTGSYTLSGDRIEIGPLAATRMMCPEPVMERERVLFDVLERARTFSRDGTELTLVDPEGHPSASLVQTDWD